MSGLSLKGEDHLPSVDIDSFLLYKVGRFGMAQPAGDWFGCSHASRTVSTTYEVHNAAVRCGDTSQLQAL